MNVLKSFDALNDALAAQAIVESTVVADTAVVTADTAKEVPHPIYSRGCNVWIKSEKDQKWYKGKIKATFENGAFATITRSNRLQFTVFDDLRLATERNPETVARQAERNAQILAERAAKKAGKTAPAVVMNMESVMKFVAEQNKEDLKPLRSLLMKMAMAKVAA